MKCLAEYDCKVDPAVIHHLHPLLGVIMFIGTANTTTPGSAWVTGTGEEASSYEFRWQADSVLTMTSYETSLTWLYRVTVSFMPSTSAFARISATIRFSGLGSSRLTPEHAR